MTHTYYIVSVHEKSGHSLSEFSISVLIGCNSCAVWVCSHIRGMTAETSASKSILVVGRIHLFVAV